MHKTLTIFICIITLWSCDMNLSRNNSNQSCNSIILPDSMLVVINNELKEVNTTDIIPYSKHYAVVPIMGECSACMSSFSNWAIMTKRYNLSDLFVIFVVVTPYPDFFIRLYYPEIVKTNNSLLFIDNTNLFTINNNIDLTSSKADEIFLTDSSFKILVKGNPILNKEILKDYLILLIQQ